MQPITWRDERLELRDGVKLISRIWNPVHGGPWPALLMRQPYGREIASTITYHHPVWWASHGYLVVIQDVRGQGGSEGNFTGFKQEASDTSQTHEWVRSLPECNGLLGTYGFSYQGLTQLLAEPHTQPPDCLAPAMTGLNEFDHWSCDGGAFWWHLGLAWGLQLAAQKAKRNGNSKEWVEIRSSLENGSYLREGPLLLKKHDPQGMAFGWLSKSNKCQQEWICHRPLTSWLRQPMLLIGGWWDPHLRGVLDLYKKSIEAGGLPELHIGPATHLQWWNESQQVLLNFFNRNLQAEKHLNLSSPKQKLWNQTTNEWQTSTQSHQSILNWGLVSNGGACIDSQEGLLRPNKKGEGLVTLVHDPWRPVPALGGHLSPQAGYVDRKNLEMRSDIAKFTTPKLEKGILHIEGIPILNLIVQADKNGFDLCVALSIVNENQSKVIQISTGFLRILGQNAKKRLLRKVTLQAALADLKKGERLRVSIAGSSWPAIGINPGEEGYQCGAPVSYCQVITMTMELSQSNFHVLPLLS